MNRLEKFVEQDSQGAETGRVAYAIKPAAMPPAGDGMTWQRVTPFSAADDVLNDPGLKDVFTAAIRTGSAVVDKAAD